MNSRSEWLKRNTQSESIRRIPTSDSWGLKNWSGFIRNQSLGLTRIETNWFLTELHQTRLKNFFGLTRMSSDWRGNKFRNKSDWFGMNFNPKLLPGSSILVYIPFHALNPSFASLLFVTSFFSSGFSRHHSLFLGSVYAFFLLSPLCLRLGTLAPSYIWYTAFLSWSSAFAFLVLPNLHALPVCRQFPLLPI